MTTEGGLDAAGHLAALTETRKKMTDAGIEVSLFIAPDLSQVEASAKIGSPFIELHTGSYAEHFDDPARREQELKRLSSSRIGPQPGDPGERRPWFELPEPEDPTSRAAHGRTQHWP